MSQQTILEKKGITKEELLALVKRDETLAGIKRITGISEKTLKKYYLKWGITFKRGRPVGTRKSYSSLIKWIRANPKILLPRTYKGIIALTGCTLDAVKTYLYRRRKEIRDYLKSLPDLRTTQLRIRSPKGVLIPFYYMKTYSIIFDPWTFRIRIRCALKPTGSRHFNKTLTFKQLKHFLKDVSLYPPTDRESPARDVVEESAEGVVTLGDGGAGEG